MADKWEAAKYKQVLPVEVIKFLNKAVDKLTTVLSVLTKILKLLKFFISAFSSYSAILQTFITFAQTTLAKFMGDLFNTGVYYNVLVPPALLKSLYDPKASSGGYQGFLSRLRVSLHNSADKNVPDFSSNAVVGGFIILCDTETLQEIYKGMQFLADMFDFFKLLPINTKPLPPRNVRTVSGYFDAPPEEGLFAVVNSTLSALGAPAAPVKKIGVKLTWDAPRVTGFTSYRISRSIKPFPTNRETTYPVPSGITKIIKAALERLTLGKDYTDVEGKKHTWPPVLDYAYNDKSFNDGNPVIVGVDPITGGGSYIDFDVKETSIWDIFGIISAEPIKKYYYVIESGFPVGLWGPRTPEVGVTVNFKGCISENEAAVVQNKKGLEYLISGSPSLGMWSTIRVGYVFPFMETVVDYLNKFLAGLAGAVKTNTKSFLDFVKGIQEKLENYSNILNTLIAVILAIEAFFAGMPRIAFLFIDPQKGGVDNFMTRVSNATQPDPGFSGPTGFSVGMVFMFGEANLKPDSVLTESEFLILKAALALKTEALSKAFQLLKKSFS